VVDTLAERAALVALDWGSTSLRAYVLDEAGATLAERSSPHGVFRLPAGGFAAAFDDLLSAWQPLPGGLPILACGMVGSAQGWAQAPYVDCPATAADVSRAIVKVGASAGRTLHIVPGVAQRIGTPDVMRGEETQVIGAIADAPAGEALVTLPGTHSKWVTVEGGRIVAFDTWMTGELFDLLGRHSSIGKVGAGDASTMEVRELAFDRGVCDALAGAPVARLLFTARSRVLLGDLAAGQALDYLSGLLIGDELRAAPAVPNHLIVGAADLCARYQRACDLAGRPRPARVAHATTRGLFLLAASAGLL
jgi:2-dehydro-3-deoxygalactonokinase